MFFRNDVGFTIYGYVLVAVVGMLIGFLTGFFISFFLKLRVRALLKDALLGAVGSTMGFFVSSNMPWSRNTITESIRDHGVAQITMNRFQYPEIVAFSLAAILPILRQLYRLRHSAESRVTAP
jgi:hypothetical protein